MRETLKALSNTQDVAFITAVQGQPKHNITNAVTGEVYSPKKIYLMTEETLSLLGENIIRGFEGNNDTSTKLITAIMLSQESMRRSQYHTLDSHEWRCPLIENN